VFRPRGRAWPRGGCDPGRDGPRSTGPRRPPGRGGEAGAVHDLASDLHPFVIGEVPVVRSSPASRADVLTPPTAWHPHGRLGRGLNLRRCPGRPGRVGRGRGSPQVRSVTLGFGHGPEVESDLGLRCDMTFGLGSCMAFHSLCWGWILAGCVRSVEPELRAPESGPPVFRARGRVAVCWLLAAPTVNRLRRVHRLALGAFGPLRGRVSLTAGRGYV
jgi:hypothetical protein